MAALSTGIGVSNTRARLTHQFGARFRFEFQRHREGFTVLVAIPFRQDTGRGRPCAMRRTAQRQCYVWTTSSLSSHARSAR